MAERIAPNVPDRDMRRNTAAPIAAGI